MIDISKIKYRFALVMSDGKNLDITDTVQSLNWEEGKGELATRITISLYNTLYSGKAISTWAKPGSLIGVLADWGTGFEEVARGTIVDWEPNLQNSKNLLEVTCYDDLYNLQKSQDNIYYSAGIDTRSAITQICSAWNVPLETYNGPKETHAKLVYKSKTISDIILDILEDAVSKGAKKCLMRNVKGAFSIIPKGSNKSVYHFGEDNSIVSNYKLSTGNLVTRVKVIGQEDDEGRTSVEAVLDGKTEYGIRQKIITKGKDDSLDEVKKSARELLKEEGDIKKTMKLESPDIPFIRKGDLIHVTLGNMKGYYFIEGIRHNVANAIMSMELELTDKE